jgi:hypothetical protein
MQVETAASLRFEVIQDRLYPSDWRVEALNSKTGDIFVAIFCGTLAKERAIEYADFKNKNCS